MAKRRTRGRPRKVVLPRKMSKLIKIALADIDKVEQSCQYAIDMSIWHGPETLSSDSGNITKEVCVVCAAGSVMAMTLKADPTEEVNVEDYPKNTHQLSAIDDLRTGDVRSAATELDLWPADEDAKGNTSKKYLAFQDKMRDLSDRTSVTSYEVDPDQFKVDMKALARRLERAGL